LTADLPTINPDQSDQSSCDNSYCKPIQSSIS